MRSTSAMPCLLAHLLRPVYLQLEKTGKNLRKMPVIVAKHPEIQRNRVCTPHARQNFDEIDTWTPGGPVSSLWSHALST
jgi:hypothetical protein